MLNWFIKLFTIYSLLFIRVNVIYIYHIYVYRKYLFLLLYFFERTFLLLYCHIKWVSRIQSGFRYPRVLVLWMNFHSNRSSGRVRVLRSGFGFGCPDTPPEPNLTRCHSSQTARAPASNLSSLYSDGLLILASLKSKFISSRTNSKKYVRMNDGHFANMETEIESTLYVATLFCSLWNGVDLFSNGQAQSGGTRI